MRHLILLITIGLTLSGMVACVGNNTVRQNIAVYDFGLLDVSKNNQQIVSKILIESPVVAEPLNQVKIRYRLNYQNPSRVFFYTESRWAAMPSALFSNRLSALAALAESPLNCSLRLKVEAFDHVFQTPATSEGVVQLSALLIEKKSGKTISKQLITESVTSASQSAQGGTAALHQASDAALKKAISWGNTAAETLCH